MVKKMVLLATFLLSFILVNAQEKTITGKVVDETGNALPGTTIVLKGSSKATLTDNDGKYSISVPSSGGELVFSYVGYQTQTIAIGESNVIDLTMQPEVTEMSEVVVIGYGVQKKSLVTGAIAKVESKDITTSVATRFEQAIQGKTAGMLVVQNSGAPGSGMTIKIRGNSSDGSNSPIYIVDGVKTGGLEYLNPSDIESIEVLKDAASAAIYGAEGGNGVVIVTTKKGQKGSSIIEYNYRHGEQTATNLPKVLNSEQYKNYFLEATRLDGSKDSTKFIALDPSVYTNWVDEVFQTAPMDEHTINFSGGNEKTNYYLSASYLNQDGIVGGEKNNFNRYSFRTNLETELKTWFTVGSNISYSRFSRKNLNATNEYGGIINNAMTYEPTLPVFYNDTNEILAKYRSNKEIMNAWNRDAEGRYYTKSEITTGEAWNPIAQIDYTDNKTMQDKIVADMHATLKPFKGLSITSRLFTDYAYQKWDNFADKNFYGVDPIKADSNTFVEQSWDRWYKYGIENFLDYNLQISDNSFELMVGQSFEDYKHFWLYIKTYNIPYTSKDFAYPGAAIDTKRFDVGDHSDNPEASRQASYFGRFNWNYKELVMFQSNIRYDGASNFGPDNKWAFFPSASLGLNLHKLEFFKSLPLSFISNLKPRVSWGQNGSRQVLGSFPYVTTMTTVYYSNASPLGSRELGKVPGKASNTALKWETSEQIDAGIDIGMFKNSLILTIDRYRKSTIDQLADKADCPAYLGLQAPPVENNGKVENKGWEFELSYKNKIGDFNYSVALNAAYLKNKVIDYGVKQGKDGANVGQMGVINRYDIGYPVWYFYGYKALGIFQTQDEIDKYGAIDTTTGNFVKYQSKAKPGDVKFENLYVDSLNGPDYKIDGNDRTYLGKPMPDWTFGMTFNFEWKGFELNMFFQGVTGNQIYWANYRKDRVTYNKAEIYYTDRWTGPGTSNRYPRATYTDANENFRISSLNIYDGDYLRLKSLTIGYTLPSKITSKVLINKLRIYYTGTNLITWTKYPGTDPEVGMYDSGWNATLGIDKGLYPPTKIHTVGINVTF